ncbi:MAG: ScpA family protein [Alphaproteobacteria bacterium]
MTQHTHLPANDVPKSGARDVAVNEDAVNRDRAGPEDWADPGDRLVVDLEGFEGPLDLLLVLAREQKVDLKRLSILKLADQYLAFITNARQLRLEIAADYLVMAAWLAYLKSRLLLPVPAEGEEPTAEAMAAALAFQLQRLEAMQTAGARLVAQPRLGLDVFPRGAPEGLGVVRKSVFSATLYDLLAAYGAQQRRLAGATLRITPSDIYSVDQALKRLRRLLGRTPDWQSMSSFLPPEIKDGPFARSALAATFVASLELARAGKVLLRQNSPFGTIYIRQAPPEAAVAAATDESP